MPGLLTHIPHTDRHIFLGRVVSKVAWAYYAMYLVEQVQR